MHKKMISILRPMHRDIGMHLHIITYDALGLSNHMNYVSSMIPVFEN